MNLLLYEVFDDAADTDVGTDADAVINEVVASVVIVPGGENENDCGNAVAYIDSDEVDDEAAAAAVVVLVCIAAGIDDSVCDSGVFAFVSASSAMTVSMIRNGSNAPPTGPRCAST